MLKPHSLINMKLLKYLEECVVIVCALINLQDSIIKNKLFSKICSFYLVPLYNIG